MSSGYTRFFIIITLILSCSLPAQAARVCSDGTGDYLTIQEAVNAATGEGDHIIEICSGVYNENIDFDAEAHSVNLHSITLKGEAGPSTPPPVKIDGGLAGSVLTVSPYNDQGVYVGQKLTKLTLENLEVTKGYAQTGGGVNIPWSGTQLIVKNCYFTNNEAYYDPQLSPSGMGGGLYALISTLKPTTIENSTFSGNVSGYDGGAVYILEMQDYASTNCITKCEFLNNTAAYVGGALYFNDTSFKVIDSNFTSNAGSVASALFAKWVNNASPLIARSKFSGNDGVAVYTGWVDDLVVENTEFSGNDSPNSSAAAGAIKAYRSSNMKIDSCIFADNTGWAAGGIYLENNTGAEELLVVNSIFWGNRDYSANIVDILAFVGTMSIADSNLEQPLPINGVTVTGNMYSLDPQFVDSANGIYRLKDTSPFVDMTTPGGSHLLDDLDGNTRPADGNGDCVALSDMGAYELIPMDGDRDGYVWVSTGTGACADCNDSDQTIHPGASEVVSDGIDQDCNGYDLTIFVSQAIYQGNSLRITATSGYGESASLTAACPGCVGGSMSWDASHQEWSYKETMGAAPASVTISGPEGSVEAQL